MSKHEYRSILKTSAITGSARIATILISFLRAKLVAIYAGPAGMGLLGLYTSSLGVVSSAASLGIDASGVRQVAAHSKDEAEVSRVILAMRRLCWVTGALAALICLALSGYISVLTFGTREHQGPIAVLSVSVLLGQITLGQSALLRGLRQIRELAVQSIVTALLSLAGAVVCLYVWREQGIVPMMLSTALLTVLGTWWYARRVAVVSRTQSWTETVQVARPLVALGLAFMVSGLVSTLGLHVIGIIVHESGGATANGYYQAAWAVTGSLISLVLAGLGQDFYPRLTEVAGNHQASNDLINRQMELGMLMALPALCLLSALAPLVIAVFFTRDFLPSAEAIPWFAIGCFGRAVSWPMAYLLLAKGMGRLFLLTEALFVGLHLLLALCLTQWLGLRGAAIAFAVLYALYSIGIAMLIGRLLGLPRSAAVWRLAALGYAVLLAIVWMQTPFGVALSLLVLALCLGRVYRLIGFDAAALRRLPLANKFFQ